MYLSQLTMDPRHPSLRQALKDRQDMHRNLAQIFEPGFLYRLTESNENPGVLVLSKNIPEESSMITRGYHLRNIQDVTALQEKFKTGVILKFNLLAAATKKAKEENRTNSRRVFLPTPELRADWLKRQGEKYGFEILEVHEPSEEKVIPVGRQSGIFKLSMIEFAGILKITDSRLFWPSWEKGIGPEKAYGAGFMLLSR